MSEVFGDNARSRFVFLRDFTFGIVRPGGGREISEAGRGSNVDLSGAELGVIEQECSLSRALLLECHGRRLGGTGFVGGWSDGNVADLSTGKQVSINMSQGLWEGSLTRS